MNRAIKTFLILMAIIALCSCGSKQIGDASPIVGEKDYSSSQLQSQSQKESTPEELTVEDILRNFNWMGAGSNYENEFLDKPFLQINADGNNGAAGVLDINRDGEMEILMAAYHVPWGIPSVEVFAIRENKLQSIGGFFEARDMPRKLSYYKDEQGQLLFLQQTEAHYGGTTTTLVATYIEDFRNEPIVSMKSHYGQEGTEIYYMFPPDEKIECTNSFLCGNFDEQYAVTEEEYNLRLSQYMDSLIWVEDVSYKYCVQYHLYNYYELSAEIRYDEISQSAKSEGLEKFQSEEEYKKTSDMVADALYKTYVF